MQVKKLELLQGFRDLVSEGLGYHLGAKSIQAEGSDKTKDQRTASNDARKHISEHLEEWIENANIEDYRAAVEDLTGKRKVLSEAMKPFNKRKAPLNKAWKYCVNVAFPNALVELDSPAAPRFKLATWIKNALKEKK